MPPSVGFGTGNKNGISIKSELLVLKLMKRQEEGRVSLRLTHCTSS